MTRREALLKSPTPLRVFLGFLLAGSVVSVGSLAWNVVSICQRRNEFAD